jgi:hypothetical protein
LIVPSSLSLNPEAITLLPSTVRDGMTEAELGGRMPNSPPSTSLPKREVDVVADYLLAKIIGRGPITREECLENFGPRARSRAEYPPG